MLIEAVLKDKKHCVRIELSNGEYCLIDREVSSEYSLRAGKELSIEELSEIKERSDFVRARERALWYLDHADRTERGLYKKLTEAGFSEKSSAKAISRLCELGLLDDRRFAENLAERLAAQNISPREISRRLYEKGVPRELIKEMAIEQSTDECSQIRALLEKKYRGGLENEEKLRKTYAALIRRGFSFGAVREVMRQYSEELESMSED